MGNFCTIRPRVRNSQGEKVESKLFKDLLSFLPGEYSQAAKLYQITKSQEFIKKWNPVLKMDENGEPLLSSIMDKTNISSFIDDVRLVDGLNTREGFYEKGTKETKLLDDTYQNYEELSDKAIKFNNESDYKDKYVANVVSSLDENGKTFIGVKIEKRTKDNTALAKQMEYNTRLNKALRSILESKGIKVGVLSNLEEKLKLNGVTDFSVAEQVADGLLELIRIAEGERGEKVLPEEFAHFALKALGDNPLVNRLINLISNEGLVRDILGDEYETYYALYEGNENKLAEEAAGKALAEHLLKQMAIPAKSYKTLLGRVTSSIKNFFKSFRASDIQRAKFQAEKGFSSLASDILSGKLSNDMKVENIHSSDMFFNISERVARDKKLLQGIIKNELKRLKVYEKRGNETFEENQKNLISKLETTLARNQEIEGIYTFVENALSRLDGLSRRLVSVAVDEEASINDKAKVLRDVRNYIYSYNQIVEDIQDALLDEELQADNRYGERVKEALDKTTVLLSRLKIQYNKVAMPLFVKFIKPFVGDNIEVPFGKWKGKIISAEELIRTAASDISFFDRWLDSMADSTSYMLKLMDQAVKKAKENARLDTIELSKKIKAAAVQLEAAGINNTDWMFERDSKGNLSGNYISEINHAKFKEAMRNMFKSLREKYGDNPEGKAAESYNRERRAWFEANMEVIDGVRRPKMSIYASQEYKNMNAAQRAYYNTIMAIKAQLDSYLPSKYTRLNNAVKIRKDLLERVKNDKGHAGKQIWENIKDQFIRRSDDTDIGDKATIIDFENNEVQSLPIYYTKLRKGESANDMSTDVTSTLTAYAAMANDFREMNKIIDVLETGRDLLNDNLKPEATRGNKGLTERFKVVGRKVENKLTKNKKDNRILQRLDDFFEMQVYGRYMADEGTVGKTNIDKGKLGNFVNRMTSLNTLALNILSGISNVATGTVMMRIESFAGEFFNEGDTIVADKNYGVALPAFLAELGSRVKTNKLALWSELFNVLQEYESDVREVDWDRKSWFSKMGRTSSLFFMNNAGEHWMQHRTSLALANAYKMKSPDGKIVSLWDAMEVVYLDPANKKLGATLQLKNGYTKANGTAFTRDDIIKFSRRTTAINQRMHGIYNKLDRNAIQRLAVGRMGIMFRKWMRPAYNRRFQEATYNYDLDAWTEGYYRTSGRFLMQLAKELKEGRFALAANWKNLKNTEKANIKRTLTEVGHFLALAIILGLLEWPDDDKEKSWLTSMIEYQARRLYTEIGVMVPGPSMIKEGLRIVKSPAAGINAIEDTLDLLGIINPMNYETFGGEDAILQSGRYKGHNRATRLFFESPVLPMNKTIYRGLHPEDGIPFFKQ